MLVHPSPDRIDKRLFPHAVEWADRIGDITDLFIGLFFDSLDHLVGDPVTIYRDRFVLADVDDAVGITLAQSVRDRIDCATCDLKPLSG